MTKVHIQEKKYLDSAEMKAPVSVADYKVFASEHKNNSNVWIINFINVIN